MSLVQDTAKAAVDTFNQAAQQPLPAAASTENMSLIDMMIKGGWAKYDNSLMSQVKANVLSGNLDSALAVCRSSNTALGRMLQKGLLRVGRPIKDIEGAIENVGKLEVAKLEKNINILGIIAGIAPMLGFVGTIFGVIKIFHEVELAGGIDIASVSGGLYVKMVSSASGLAVGILAYLGYHILNMMVERLILRMETDAVEFIDLLDEPGR
ncbi:MAG: biopolymer transporter ExbB [Sphingobacterium sp.]|nr:biopolymer transporter ExbB [Sphingobacterium sp.]